MPTMTCMILLAASAAPRLQAGTPLMVGAQVGTETPGLGSAQPPFVVMRGPVRVAVRARAMAWLDDWLGTAQVDADPLALTLAGYAPPAALGWAGLGRNFPFAGGAVAPWLGAGGVATAGGRGFGPALGVIDVGTMGGGVEVYAATGVVWPVLTQGALAGPHVTGTWPPFDVTVGFSRPEGPGRLHVEASLRVGPGVRPLWSGAGPLTDGAIIALLGLGYAPGTVAAAERRSRGNGSRSGAVTAKILLHDHPIRPAAAERLW